jgi:ribosomal protein L15
MFYFKPPFRLVIAHALLDGNPRNAQEIAEKLAPQYPRERQVNLREIEHHLQALKAVGILEIAQEQLCNEKLVLSYKITGHGSARVRHFLS